MYQYTRQMIINLHFPVPISSAHFSAWAKDILSACDLAPGPS